MEVEALVRQKTTSILVGSIGETQTTVHTEGTVLVGNEAWDVTSAHPIAPNSRVRVKRVVLEVE